MSLTIDLAQGDTHWLLKLSGDLDYGECASFRMNIDRILKSAPPRRSSTSLSSSTWTAPAGLLLSLSKEYGAQGGSSSSSPTRRSTTSCRSRGSTASSRLRASVDEAKAVLGEEAALDPLSRRYSARAPTVASMIWSAMSGSPNSPSGSSSLYLSAAATAAVRLPAAS